MLGSVIYFKILWLQPFTSFAILIFIEDTFLTVFIFPSSTIALPVIPTLKPPFKVKKPFFMNHPNYIQNSD